MGNRIENPNDSRPRRLPRLIPSSLLFLFTASIATLMPGEVYAQAGIKEVSGAELIRPTSGNFAEGPLRIHNIPKTLSENLRSKGVDLVSSAESIRGIDQAQSVEIPGMLRSLLAAGESITQEINPVQADNTSGN
jgi:hypothetical protein